MGDLVQNVVSKKLEDKGFIKESRKGLDNAKRIFDVLMKSGSKVLHSSKLLHNQNKKIKYEA